MEAIVKILPLIIQVSLFLLVFSVGLRATLNDALYLLRRPALLFRALLAIQVIVPVAAALIAAAFPLTPVVKLALILMAVSPLPPTLSNKQLKAGGRDPYVVGLLVAVSLLSVVLVPLTLVVMSAVFPADVSIAPAQIAVAIATSILLPLAIGMIVRHFAPAFAEKAAPGTGGAGSLLLLAGILPVLIAIGPQIIALLGNGSVLAIAAVIIVGLVAGHLLGGPHPEDREVLAIASTSRHPAIALLIVGANFPEEKKLATAAVLLAVIVSGIVAVPYSFWRKRGRREPVVETATEGSGIPAQAGDPNIR